MTKSKTNSSNLHSTQGDFRLQTKRHASASHTPRVQSRSCSLVQHGSISPSPTSTPPRTKVAFADFADFSSAARVLSKRKNKTMQKKGSLAPSLYPPSSDGRNNGSYSSSRANPLPIEGPVGFNPRGSCLGSSGLTPAPSTVSPNQPSSGKCYPSTIPSGITPSLASSTSLASPVKDKS